MWDAADVVGNQKHQLEEGTKPQEENLGPLADTKPDDQEGYQRQHRQVADEVHHGFQGAQIALNMAQSTLSTHLATLETKLRSKLCLRGRTGFRLTAAGEDTYAAATELLRNLERFEATMARVHSRTTARLRIGIMDAITTFDALDIPGSVARFTHDHPEARIELDTDTPAGLQNSLLRATRDVVVGASLQPLPGLDYIELATEVHHLCCGSEHPWYPRPDSDLGPDEFVKAAFSIRSYMHFDDTYRLGRVIARATVGSMEAQEILVLSGSYIAFPPEHRGDFWQERGRMHAVKPNDWSFCSRFFAAYDPRREGAPLRRAFVEELRRSVGSADRRATICSG